MATANFYINAEDGWVQIATSPDFLRVTAVPRRHSFLIADGANAPAVNSTRATGTITLSVTGPLTTQTVTINGQVYTFKTVVVSATDVLIGVDNPATVTNLVAKINANSTTVTAVAGGSVATLTAVNPGTGGNAITLSQAATNVAVSGATLTGAVDFVYGILVNDCDQPFFVDVPITGNVYARVLDSQPDKAVRLDVFTA